MEATKVRPREICISLLESDPLRLVGLRSILERVPDFRVTPMTLSEVVAGQNADVTLLGNHSFCFFDTMSQLRACHQDLKVLVTGMGTNDETILKAIVYGAKGYVDEAAPATDLVQAIRAIHEGSMWASRRVLSMFIERSGDLLRYRQVNAASLTSREKQVLQMLVEGRSNKEIGSPLGIEERTVKAHVAKLMRKVGARNRISLSVQAIKCSLVSAR